MYNSKENLTQRQERPETGPLLSHAEILLIHKTLREETPHITMIAKNPGLSAQVPKDMLLQFFGPTVAELQNDSQLLEHLTDGEKEKFPQFLKESQRRIKEELGKNGIHIRWRGFGRGTHQRHRLTADQEYQNKLINLLLKNDLEDAMDLSPLVRQAHMTTLPVETKEGAAAREANFFSSHLDAHEAHSQLTQRAEPISNQERLEDRDIRTIGQIIRNGKGLDQARRKTVVRELAKIREISKEEAEELITRAEEDGEYYVGVLGANVMISFNPLPERGKGRRISSLEKIQKKKALTEKQLTYAITALQYLAEFDFSQGDTMLGIVLRISPSREHETEIRQTIRMLEAKNILTYTPQGRTGRKRKGPVYKFSSPKYRNLAKEAEKLSKKLQDIFPEVSK
jgi:hypothetical protein